MREIPQIPVAVDRTRAPISWAGAALLLTLFCFPNVSSAASVVSLSGRILGLVTDSTGMPQMGAAILLLNREDKVYDRVLTDEKGSFVFDGLSAGMYSVRVTLTSFMPVSKSNIVVQPGMRTLLNVSLAGLFSSIQLVYPTLDQRAVMNDDWKWVLRTSNATRPVLRLLPDWNSRTSASVPRSSSAIFSDTRALVKVSAGDGGATTSFGNESDLGTAFSLATSLLGRNQLQVSGNLGFAAQSGAPSAGFSASYSRTGAVDSTPMVTVSMRQMYLPGPPAEISGPNPSEPVLRAMTLSMKDATQLSDALRFEYGFALDEVSFGERLGFFSPHARLIYSISDKEQVEFSYTSGIPRSGMFLGMSSTEADLQSDLSALALFPRISVRNSHARVQQAKNFEAGYHRTVGSRKYSTAVFRESVSDAALTMSGADTTYPAWDVLPDLFSNSSVFNAGGYRSLGYMASVAQQLGDNLKVEVMYSTGGALVAERTEIEGDSPDALRSMIRTGRRRAVTSQVSGVIPWSATTFLAGYQWTDQRSVTPSHFYATQRTRPEAGLNIQVRQPIPTGSLLPVRIEASADLRNLLAEGYLPFMMNDGRPILLMHTPRSFRGGLSFIF